jgi:hypothetical protein
MSRGEQKRERQRLIDARQERERAAFRESVPFTREELVGWLEELSRLQPSPEPFGHTRGWAVARGFAWEPIVRAFASLEISSDQELLRDTNPYHLFGPTPRRLAWMPIERPQLEALMVHLDELGGQGVGCDHTPRQTAAWLAEQGLPVPETLAALRVLGGYCDCEMANVEPEWIYPPGLQLVPDRPPPKPRTAAPKVDAYRDQSLVLPLPGKPWRVRPAAGRAHARLVLQFGQGFEKPQLRILAAGKPTYDQDWCVERWLQMHLEGWTYLRGEKPADAQRELAARWLKQDRELVGPEAVDYGGIPGRWYVSKGKGYPVDAGWCLLDAPGGFRVVELDVGTGSWDPFHREAKKVLARLAPS